MAALRHMIGAAVTFEINGLELLVGPCGHVCAISKPGGIVKAACTRP